MICFSMSRCCIELVPVAVAVIFATCFGVSVRPLELTNKMGIPKGYNAFFTRGLDGWMESLKSDLQVAQEISGPLVSNLIGSLNNASKR